MSVTSMTETYLITHLRMALWNLVASNADIRLRVLDCCDDFLLATTVLEDVPPSLVPEAQRLRAEMYAISPVRANHPHTSILFGAGRRGQKGKAKAKDIAGRVMQFCIDFERADAASSDQSPPIDDG
jgi:hypothetical protein